MTTATQTPYAELRPDVEALVDRHEDDVCAFWDDPMTAYSGVGGEILEGVIEPAQRREVYALLAAHGWTPNEWLTAAAQHNDWALIPGWSEP